ncbi:MAG: tetratricopeptide repeat protein [Candidatus Cloacimonetes bacterium]|nr:tetratricopeptide repeat protein [Candidatus Cloacimonadota bacterium]
MKNLIPQFISNKFSEKKYSGRFIAATMFIDISGFTAMTQSLMKNGKEGAEILTDVINKVFSPSINSIYKNGGFVSIFAGDAFTAIFPVEKTTILNALSSSLEINKIFKETGMQITKFGDFQLSVKIGLSYGKVEWKIIKSEKLNSYYFRGEGIDNCAFSEHKCNKQEIVFDKYILDKFDAEKSIEFLPKAYGYFLLKKMTHTISPIVASIQKLNTGNFVQKTIINLKSQGEFRDIISCFISFEETENFAENISEIINLTNQFGGYFNKIDFGDKGGVILVIFGAPLNKEKIYLRACNFAIAVRSLHKNIFNIRIGLTYGTAFVGFVGSEIRCEYTALGMAVNLSARFMMKAELGEIFIDENIKKQINTNFEIETIPDQNFKGFIAKIPVNKLLRKIEIIKKIHIEGKLIGREKELQNLEKLIKPIYAGKFGGIIYINGSAGIGKSRFVNELKEIANRREEIGKKKINRKKISWFFLPCDEILQKSFNPLITFLYQYFEQTEQASEKENRNKFENKLKHLIENTNDSEIENELIRTKSFLGALINISWKDSLYEQLDAKSRYENIIFAVKNLIKAESLQKPIIIELEDGHWIDSDSRKFLEILTRNVENFPFVIISACRYQDDGSKFKFNLKNVIENSINIKFLSKAGTKILIQIKIRELNETENEQTIKIPEQTLELIFEKSEGNPFFIEQIVLYFSENNLFDENFTIRSKEFEIPKNINAVIIARIDRLKMELKNVIKTASVLGREFAIKILSKMLLKQSIREQLEEGEKEIIWETLSELKYIFKHALIREAIYDMQLRKELRELHKLAGEVIEELFKENLIPFYSDLANHFVKAEKFDKAIDYLEKAGNQSKKSYENDNALRFFSRLITHLEKKLGIISSENEQYKELKTKLIKNILKKGDVLQFLGKWDEALESFTISQELAIEFDNKKLISESLGRIAYIHKLYGNYEKAVEFINQDLIICEELDDKWGLGKCYSNMGNTFVNQGKYDEAMEYYKKDLDICKEINNKSGYSKTIGNMGIIYDEKGNYKKAMECFNEDLKFKEEVGDKRGIGILNGSIGITYWKSGNIPKAMECIEKQLKICVELGDRSSLSMALGNLGILNDVSGNFEIAKQYYEKQLINAQELGDKSEIARVMGNMGIVYQNLGNLEKAVDYYSEAIRLKKELGVTHTLIYPLSSKAEALYRLKKFAKAKEICDEYRKISEEIQDKSHIFLSKVLGLKISFRMSTDSNYKIENCIVPMENMLKDENKDIYIAFLKSELTAMYYEMENFEMTRKYKKEAISLFQRLYKETPDIDYKNRIAKMEELQV